MRKDNLRRISVVIGVLLLNFVVVGVGYSAEATIKKINTEKKTVVINGSASDGFEKGTKVCFYNAETLKRVTCGKVKKAGKLTALIQVSSKGIKKVQMEHTVSTHTDKVLSVSGDQQNPDETTVFNRTNNKFTGAFFYTYSPMSPVGLNAVKFLAPDAKQKGAINSLWGEVSDSSLKSTLLTLGGSFAYNINELFSVTLGGSYSFVDMEQILSEYDTSNKNFYTYTEQNPSLFSIFLDFTAYRKYLGVTGNNFSFLVGILYANFSSKFEATHGVGQSRDAGSEVPMVSVKTSMSVVGARLGSTFTMALSQMLGLYVSLVATVPIVGSPSYSTTLEEEYNTEFSGVLTEGKTLESDVEDAMGASKKFGLELSLGTSISF